MPDDPSAPLHLTLRQADELEPVEDDELTDYLVELAPEIGWIIIHFNSLEDHVSGFIREAILRDAFQDERMDVFLAGMLFSAKARALLDLYGQMIEYGGSAVTHEDLRKVDVLLTECATRRNARGLDRDEAGQVRAREVTVEAHRHQPSVQEIRLGASAGRRGLHQRGP